MFGKESERKEKTIKEQQASCFGILDATEEDMDRAIRLCPYVFSRLKDI